MNDDTALPQPEAEAEMPASDGNLLFDTGPAPNEPPADDQPAEQAAPPSTRPEWQQRVHDEHAELQSKYQRLLAWLKEETHDVAERDLQLLRDQAEAMQKYLTVLEARIANWL